MTEAEQIQQSAEKLADTVCAELRKMLVRANVVVLSGLAKDYNARAEDRTKTNRLLSALDAVFDAPEIGNDAWCAMEKAYEDMGGR